MNNAAGRLCLSRDVLNVVVVVVVVMGGWVLDPQIHTWLENAMQAE